MILPASVQDRDGAKLLFASVSQDFPKLRCIYADGGYAGKLIEWVAIMCDWLVQIVKRSDAAKGFELVPKRWKVERTFGWLGRYRRNSRDYERLNETARANVHIAMINLMLHRLAPET